MTEEDVELAFNRGGVTLLGDGEFGAEISTGNCASGGIPAIQRSRSEVGVEAVLIQTSICWTCFWKAIVSAVSESTQHSRILFIGLQLVVVCAAVVAAKAIAAHW